ncbi:hypothetical protein C7C46_04310 [Streptomyces tateyamensis]|uniref:DUF3566 domain-containing protein n=2 Tax=Streptomyces tateyamensis TaxID=565073 RepID=A0A2V4P9T7_9ACTN|nr:hypothetical protein C7C46_04310 [Streptomyces tateyamensis]
MDSTGGYGQPAQPPVPPPPGTPPAAGYSQPTTYTKGQPTPPRGTRTGPAGPGAATGPGAPRRPAQPTPAAGTPVGAAGRMRRARLRITRADPWSVMKVSFLLSLAVGIIMIVAAAVLWTTLDAMGVFDSIGKTLKDVTGSGASGSGGVNIMDYVGFGKVLTFTALIAVVDVVLLTALSTLAAFIYNAAAGFTGGIELTLTEEE